jgi:hypothetical protein
LLKVKGATWIFCWFNFGKQWNDFLTCYLPEPSLKVQKINLSSAFFQQ